MTPYEAVREEFDFPFELYPFQIDEVNQLCGFHRAGFYWEPGCVDAHTEYLTPTGWQRISEYTSGPVAQYDPSTNLASFVEPNEFVKEPCDSMIRVKTQYGLDQLLSDGHKVLLYRGDRPDRPYQTVSAGELLQDHDLHAAKVRRHRTQNHIPFNHAAIGSTFAVEGGRGIDLTDAQLRLQVAVMADGYFPPSATKKCHVRVKKERKVQRMRVLLDDAGVAYTESQKDYPTASGYHVFAFFAPLKLKTYGEVFWGATQAQLGVIALEVTMWDSHWSEGQSIARFSTTDRASADFIQYVWSATGRTARITEDKRAAKYRAGVCYTVTRRGPAKNRLHLRSRETRTMWREPSTDGFKYCFNVPTGFLVLRRNGCVFTTGNTGKTAGATHYALYFALTAGANQWVIVMPPILLLQWARWLRSIKSKRTGKSPTVTVYDGSPAQRKKLDLTAMFILVSYGKMKNDLDALCDTLHGTRYGVIADEGHAVKNIESQTHKSFKRLVADQWGVIVTGTPLTSPIDGYAYIKTMAPHIYRNFRQFEQIHVKERDIYNAIIAWDNLELLATNMKVNTSRVLRREVQKQLPPVTFSLMHYNLAPAHLKLYERIADEKLVEFEDGREINAISTQAMYSALQQVVINWGYFEDDESLEPAALEIIDEVFNEIGPGAKLAIVGNFIRSNRYLLSKLEKYGVVAVYGEVSRANKQKAIAKFIEDPKCRGIILQPQSAGFGVDGLQHVCSDMLILEAPTTAPPFYQVTARLDRDGQTNPVNCRIAVANKTVQVRMFKHLLANDATVNSVQGGFKDLKEAIYGD